jgi:hypothetical protein
MVEENCSLHGNWGAKRDGKRMKPRTRYTLQRHVPQ